MCDGAFPKVSAEACLLPGLDGVGTRSQGFHWALLGFYILGWPCKASPIKLIHVLEPGTASQACRDTLDLGLLLRSSWFTTWPC